MRKFCVLCFFFFLSRVGRRAGTLVRVHGDEVVHAIEQGNAAEESGVAVRMADKHWCHLGGGVE